MAKKPLYEKYSNIEQYLICRNKSEETDGLSLSSLDGSETANRINEIVEFALSKGLKNPYLRFIMGKGSNTFLFYTNSKSANAKHIDGWQCFESAKQYLSEYF